jgi:SAM-dependent methyltransferase
MNAKASWPLRLPSSFDAAAMGALKRDIADAEQQAQYGWGHTIDFGSFTQPGLFQDWFLEIVGVFDQLGWLPADLRQKVVADVGCYSGGITAVLAARQPDKVYAIDEIAPNLKQCEIVCKAFGLQNVVFVRSSLYRLRDAIPDSSVDLIILAGVLYHLSDMLVGLLALRELLKPQGVLLIQSLAVDDGDRSYANFGRFCGGSWWHPTGRCIEDLCEFAGYVDTTVHFYKEGRCVARAARGQGEIPFKRGINWDFEDLRDARARTLDRSVLAPARLSRD